MKVLYFILAYSKNNLTNGTDIAITDGGAPYKTVAILCIVFAMSLATILGNVAIILCIARNRNMLTIYNIYAASLASADLLVGIVVMPLMSVYSYLGYWPMGDNFCTTWIVFDGTCCTVSMLHLDAIAFDRYKSVTRPLYYRATFTKTRAVKISVTMWMLGFALWIPSVLWFRINDQLRGTTVTGECLFVPDKYYILGYAAAVYYIPMSFMVLIYLKVMYALRQRYISTTIQVESSKEFVTEINHRKGGHTSKDYNSSSNCNDAQILGEAENGKPNIIDEARLTSLTNPQVKGEIKTRTKYSQKAKISTQNRRCITTLGGIIVVFLISWLPFVVFWPIAAFCETCIPAELYEGSYWLSYSNSLVNSYIYFVLNRDFKQALKCLFSYKRQRLR